MPLLAGTLAEMVNASLHEGFFLNALKHGMVRPRLKKPSLDSDDVKSYRPISNLIFVSKMVEWVVVRRFDEHVEITAFASRSTICIQSHLLHWDSWCHSSTRFYRANDWLRWHMRTCAAWYKFSFWYCWSWNTYACTTTAFRSRGPSSNLVWFVPMWSNPSLLKQHTAVWTLQSWLQCATRVNAGTKGIHRLHRRIGYTHRRFPAWSAPVCWRQSADEAHTHQHHRIHHPDSAAMHSQMVLIQTTSAESIENWSYLV